MDRKLPSTHRSTSMIWALHLLHSAILHDHFGPLSLCSSEEHLQNTSQKKLHCNAPFSVRTVALQTRKTCFVELNVTSYYYSSSLHVPQTVTIGSITQNDNFVTFYFLLFTMLTWYPCECLASRNAKFLQTCFFIVPTLSRVQLFDTYSPDKQKLIRLQTTLFLEHANLVV